MRNHLASLVVFEVCLRVAGVGDLLLGCFGKLNLLIKAAEASPHEDSDDSHEAEKLGLEFEESLQWLVGLWDAFHVVVEEPADVHHDSGAEEVIQLK